MSDFEQAYDTILAACPEACREKCYMPQAEAHKAANAVESGDLSVEDAATLVAEDIASNCGGLVVSAVGIRYCQFGRPISS